jgi:hypothetical protein
MTDAAREQQADTERFKGIFNKSSMAQKLMIKAMAGFTVMMDSHLDRAVKFDAIKATIDMIMSGSELHAFNTLQKCNKDTQVPIDAVLSIMALSVIDELHRRELRFNTMMQLFVDEAEKRAAP